MGMLARLRGNGGGSILVPEWSQNGTAAMPVTLSIKNVPDEIAQRLRERAARNHRSLQGELMAMLEEAAAPPPQRKKSIQEIYEEVQASGLRSASDSTEIVRAMRDSRYGD